MTKDEYKDRFAEPTTSMGNQKEADTRAGRALSYALDIRKFEIELYWKRATYFWAFIAAAFAAYALTYKTADHEPWLSLVFSSLGLVFSFAWYLVNRGSKFWQNNWERHVDLLEDITLGPLYKIVATNSGSNIITDADQFSVTKINQMLSFFVTIIWILLFVKAVGPISFELKIDFFKSLIVIITVSALPALWWLGRSSQTKTLTKLHEREFDIKEAQTSCRDSSSRK